MTKSLQNQKRGRGSWGEPEAEIGFVLFRAFGMRDWGPSGGARGVA